MPAHPRSHDRVPILRAVYLLRVSSARQMHTATDIDPEGNSIPTQRGCCDVKCKELRAIKVGEYIEPGYSGQSIEKRPVFKSYSNASRNSGMLITSSSTCDPAYSATTKKP